MEKINKRNVHGVKNSVDMYRTFAGEPYSQWASDWIDERAKAYREMGIRCRKAAGELFVHEDDQGKAEAVDSAREWGAP